MMKHICLCFSFSFLLKERNETCFILFLCWPGIEMPFGQCACERTQEKRKRWDKDQRHERIVHQDVILRWIRSARSCLLAFSTNRSTFFSLLTHNKKKHKCVKRWEKWPVSDDRQINEFLDELVRNACFGHLKAFQLVHKNSFWSSRRSSFSFINTSSKWSLSCVSTFLWKARAICCWTNDKGKDKKTLITILLLSLY